MPQFTAYGVVIETRDGDLGVQIENEVETKEFWDTHKIKTDLGWLKKELLVISIGRRQDIDSCEVGDRVSITVKVVDRANGKRGIETVDFQVLERKT